jgi:hypothetical protein
VRAPWVPCLALVAACRSGAPAGPAAPSPVPAAAAGRPALDLRADGLGPVILGEPVSAASLRAALPGYDVREEEASYEDIPVERIVVADGDAELFWITPDGGKVAAIVVTSPAASSALGVNVGSSYRDAVGALGPLLCEIAYDDDTFAFHPLCNNPDHPGVIVVFESVDLPDDIMPGDSIPPDRTDALLSAATVEAIVI